ncbi:RNA polymerase sigma-70 factor, ECF subfamily [Kaistia soli DSM 19436]|uniref:RNA polymerase sigma-70 factor, ECF subfamily n=1 Tax=Kaistia soli DSM 19436 TaxID=1122133 RepID=A0A1M5CF75_9HYPH|nr:sigma-70 family RNA polymerase sigma factor [Kaistia soli]SHF53349.1 RNA polymerase sigma-70 factor, ECF subfamily [Kaistia soli DSM 19436]
MIDREEAWASLMRSALAGDQAAYESLLRELAPALRASVRRRLAGMGQSVDACEDIVQETLLAIHLKRHTWRTSDPFGPWLFTVARNKLIDHVRKRGRRIEIPIEDFADILPAAEERPGTDAADVERHLAELPTKQRAVLRAVAVEGASVAEAARKHGMTPGAVRVALHRGFASLASRLRAQD